MPTKPIVIVIVLGNGPIHISKATTAALAVRAHYDALPLGFGALAAY